MIDLSTLNDKQRSAVESQSDQVIILAGPGSGK
jgi:superfamily I DNA/RNA helicase